MTPDGPHYADTDGAYPCMSKASAPASAQGWVNGDCNFIFDVSPMRTTVEVDIGVAVEHLDSGEALAADVAAVGLFLVRQVHTVGVLLQGMLQQADMKDCFTLQEL